MCFLQGCKPISAARQKYGESMVAVVMVDVVVRGTSQSSYRCEHRLIRIRLEGEHDLSVNCRYHASAGCDNNTRQDRCCPTLAVLANLGHLQVLHTAMLFHRATDSIMKYIYSNIQLYQKREP